MEKKQSRTAQTSSKGTGTEPKKNQDVTSGKFWPRGGKRREVVGGSFPIKNEPNRKANPQRNKYIDKRPKPRGGYNSGIISGKEDTELTDKCAELESVFVTGSKKQSFNHLLNFHYTPRGEHLRSDALLSHKKDRWFTTHKHKYCKEQFLQANCQFVVKSNGDYKLYLNNPDALVDWDLVEQIHVQVSEFPSCPICLYPPVAAKMTRCGHVYCWPCVLHYLTLSEKTWCKCPICYQTVHKNDLKSVIAIPHAAFNVGEYITLRLMKRAQGSLTAIPVDESKITRNVLLNVSEDKINTVYSKLLLADPAEVMSIITRERRELTAQLKEDEHTPEECFIEQAFLQLEERENIVFNMFACYKGNSAPNTKQPNIETNEQNTNSASKYETFTEIESANSEESIVDANTNLTTNAVDDKPTHVYNENHGQTSVKYYYFYQAADGQHIYLHALNIQMLEHTYGCLENCPTTLQGRILEKECGSMTEELRQRLRYLLHLPVTCQFEVAEIQLRHPTVCKETLEYFHEQIETRKKRRQRRARDEKRREKRILDEDNRSIRTLVEVNMHIESLYQFPKFESEKNTSSTDGENQSSYLLESSPQQEQYAGPSFAKMLVTGKDETPSRPGNQLRRQMNSNSSIDAKQTKSIQEGRNEHSDSDSQLEGYVPVPAYNQSFSEAIAFALEKASISDTSGACPSDKKKKKKKNKQKILFATSMIYSEK